MNTQFPILVVEDEVEIAEIVQAYLQRDGFDTLYAANGVDALELHARHNPCLVILDIRMPGMNGWQVLSELRRRGNTPVLMLTASDGDTDKLAALRIGADDYVIKPFNPDEVVARTHAILRRTACQPHPIAAVPQVLKTARLALYPEEFRVVNIKTEEELAIALTTTEFRLLAHLMRYPKKVFSRLELLENCLAEGETLERTVDSHISKLRKKLEEAGISGIPESVRGLGYRLGD
ncbi:response regulator transcription factor [Erwinia sp. S43]|uniref:response regulator n=1 Tax=unclassified Erwinia TaxID=2622719 RepID=UPI00190C03F4|nr:MULTISPECIES: response regulator [unclassified Erwinia]MBK0032927.1 response regulator transcription factor [Erwinia sp. S43]MCW1873417.1 response regulator [Erwinia sp. INIA01]